MVTQRPHPNGRIAGRRSEAVGLEWVGPDPAFRTVEQASSGEPNPAAGRPASVDPATRSGQRIGRERHHRQQRIRPVGVERGREHLRVRDDERIITGGAGIHRERSAIIDDRIDDRMMARRARFVAHGARFGCHRFRGRGHRRGRDRGASGDGGQRTSGAPRPVTGEVDDVAPRARARGGGSPFIPGGRNRHPSVEELVERGAVDPLVDDEIGGQSAKGLEVGDQRLEPQTGSFVLPNAGSDFVLAATIG